MTPEVLAALRSEWEAGQASDAVLAEKYGITLSRIRVLATKNGWMKRTAPTEDAVQKTISLFSFDPNEQATLSAAVVVATHRKDVARLRSIAATLIDRLGLELSGQPMPENMICRGSRESPADLLEKLSRVMVRTTEIERQAYGLKTFNPEQAATDAELQTELDRLTQEVEDIAKNKASSGS